MAKIVPGPLAGQISGRLGATIFSHNKGGPYVRNGTIPTTSTTPAALAAKARLGDGATAWTELTAGQRLAWGEWAAENPVMDRVGHQITLTGISAFVGNYCRMHLVGETPLLVPPIVAGPIGLTSTTLTVDIGLGGTELAFTPTPLGADDALWFEAVVVNSPAINHVRNLTRFVSCSAKALASPYDYLTDLEAVFGTLSVGQTVITLASVFDRVTGLISQPLRNSGVCVST